MDKNIEKEVGSPNPIRVGISIGDINGIGLEVILKTLSSHEVLKKANFYLFCST